MGSQVVYKLWFIKLPDASVLIEAENSLEAIRICNEKWWNIEGLSFSIERVDNWCFQSRKFAPDSRMI